MGKKINKEKEGLTIKFTARLPQYQHEWLKVQSEYQSEKNKYTSMNTIISEAIEQYMKNS
jgi:hypothetical protein